MIQFSNLLSGIVHLALFCSALGLAETPPNVVLTQSGFVRGSSAATATSFLGIPFASPPVGALRWRAPQPPRPWFGTRSATTKPPMCPQRNGILTAGEVTGSEDCLFLNVWVPAGTSPTARLPVMTFIHGGGLSIGSATDSYLDGTNLAARGKVIVVTIQYRLGTLGYMAHPALGAENSGASGNYGLMDQIAALKWVNKNISNFGGNPGNVTLFGESGGATSVCAVVASPLSAGLFARAIMESGGHCQSLPKAQAEQEGLTLAAKAGCSGAGASAAACLRSRSLNSVVNPGVMEMISTKDFRRTTAMLTTDGYSLPDSPTALFRAGKAQPVPLMLGNNEKEGLVFIPYYFSAAAFGHQVRNFYGQATYNRVYAQYPPAHYDDAQGRAQAIFADSLFDCGNRTISRYKASTQAAPVYRYIYNFQVTLLGRKMAAFHGSELPLVFQNSTVIKPVPTREELEVEQNFLMYWTQFAKNGDPNSSGLPNWDKFIPSRDNFLLINDRPTMQRDHHTAQCDVWDSIFGE